MNSSIAAAHRAILDDRLASYQAGKSKVITHAELMRRLRAPEKPVRPRKAKP